MYCFVYVCVCFVFVYMLYVIYNIFLELIDIFLKDSKGFFEFFCIYLLCIVLFVLVCFIFVGILIYVLKKLYFFLKSIDNRFMML